MDGVGGGHTDSDNTRARFGRVVQDTLAHVVVKVGAVVVCFHGGAFGFVGVGVEGVEVGADALYWGEVLNSTG
jgi:hypothetical protein